MMPNVIPARVANYYDLHGMNMTVDAGHASTLAAFEVAARFLCSGELEMAIVGGINGNSADEVQPAFDLPLAEGVALFAVTTVRRARRPACRCSRWSAAATCATRPSPSCRAMRPAGLSRTRARMRRSMCYARWSRAHRP